MFNSPQQPGSSVFGSYTMQFAKGWVRANDGCNSLGATATVGPHTVTGFGDVGSSLVDCTGSALRVAYDKELFQGSVGWRVAGGRLTLTSAGGDSFEYEPLPTGYPSDLAGVKHATTTEKSIDGVRFRIYAIPRTTGGDQCLTMEFDSPAGTPWEPVSACRDSLAKRYVVNPTDFTSARLPSGTGVVFSAVPNGSATRIVFRPTSGGRAIDLTLTPLPGTTFQAFYGFVAHPQGGVTVTFFNAKGVPYKDVWTISW